MTLQCRGNNHGAIRLYQRLGFHEYGRLSDFVASGDERWDKVLMAIDLAHRQRTPAPSTPRRATRSASCQRLDANALRCC